MSKLNKIVQQNFKRWNNAIKSKDERKVAALYFQDATLLPTLSYALKKGRKNIQNYFKFFVKKNPKGKILKENIHPITDSMYLHVGLYDFSIGSGPKKSIVKARFSYLWAKDNKNSWKIVHHHSSFNMGAKTV